MVPLRLRLVVFLLLFLCKKSAGQNTYFQDDSHTFYGGLVAGGNFTQVDGDTYEGYSKAGINVGAIVYARLSPATGISMEMIYTQKGSAAAYTSGSAVGYYEAQYHLKLNYVEVPVLFHFFTSRRLRYEAGASYAYLIRSDEWLYDASNFYINPDITTIRNFFA
ncbi:MAG: PorT family protein [Taibaiella sp.]|nr:PorT family protein [Taibaiella sp.]